MLRRVILGVGAAALSGCAAVRVEGVHTAVDANTVFAALQALVGRWVEADPTDRAHRETVDYRLLANGSVLVESWSLRSGATSMTLYYLDGDDLVAAHYCPQGNQPRLRLRGVTEGGFLFQVHDGDNLRRGDRMHQHQFWISVDGADVFRRAELYVPNGSDRPVGLVAASDATRYLRQNERAERAAPNIAGDAGERPAARRLRG